MKNEEEIIEIFKRFGKDHADIIDMIQVSNFLNYNVGESYLRGLIKINDVDNDG